MSRPITFPERSRHGLPIFQTYTLDHLRDVSGYHRDYISDVRCGAQPLTDRFKRVMAATLRLPEKELFRRNRKNGASRPKAPRRTPTATSRRGTSGR